MVDTRHEYARVADAYLPVALVVFAVVAGATGYCLLRWRARDGQDREASRRHRNAPLEIAYVAALAIVVAALLTLTLHVEGREDATARQPALRVDVTAAQWTWTFAYPGTGVVQEPREGRPTTLVVPAGRAIVFAGRSADVIHDFWVPDVRFQRQLFPGHTEHFDLVFARPGTYQGVCSQFCGLYHQNMHFDVRVVPPAAFARWLGLRRAAPA